MQETVMASLSRKASVTTDKGVARAHAILGVARQIFASEGYAGFSMRSVAMRLNVSLSNVQHYYRDKDTLVEALLLYILDDYHAAVVRLNERMTGQTQVERVVAAMRLFLDEVRRPEVAAVFMDIWALANRSTAAAGMLDKVRARELKEFMRLIDGLLPGFTEQEYAARAILMIAQIEGLMGRMPRPGQAGPSPELLTQAALQALTRLATEP